MSDVGAGKAKVASDLKATGRDGVMKRDNRQCLTTEESRSPVATGRVRKHRPAVTPSIQHSVFTRRPASSDASENPARAGHPTQPMAQSSTAHYEAILLACSDDVPTLQPQRCLQCVRLYEPAFPCRFLA